MKIQKIENCKVLMVDEDNLLTCIETSDLLGEKGYFRIQPNQTETLIKLLNTAQEFDAIVEFQKGETSRLKSIT